MTAPDTAAWLRLWSDWWDAVQAGDEERADELWRQLQAMEEDDVREDS